MLTDLPHPSSASGLTSRDVVGITSCQDHPQAAFGPDRKYCHAIALLVAWQLLHLKCRGLQKMRILQSHVNGITIIYCCCRSHLGICSGDSGTTGKTSHTSAPCTPPTPCAVATWCSCPIMPRGVLAARFGADIEPSSPLPPTPAQPVAAALPALLPALGMVCCWGKRRLPPPAEPEDRRLLLTDGVWNTGPLSAAAVAAATVLPATAAAGGQAAAAGPPTTLGELD